MDWIYDNNPTNEYGDTIKKYVYSRTKNKELSKNTERIISLYNFLKSHNFKNPKELRDSVFLDKDRKHHVFSEDQSNALFRMLKNQKGGAHSPEILDNVIKKVINKAREYIPDAVKGPIDTITPFILIAKTAEELPALGPFISLWLDAATTALPVIATTIQNLSPEIIGFVPIPEAGPIGALIGWTISAIFVFLALVINISRGHFGEGFINAFLLVPFVGTSLHNAAIKGELFVAKSAMQRDRIIESAKSVPFIGSTISDVLNNYTPDLTSDGSTPPQPVSTKNPRDTRTPERVAWDDHMYNILKAKRDASQPPPKPRPPKVEPPPKPQPPKPQPPPKPKVVNDTRTPEQIAYDERMYNILKTKRNTLPKESSGGKRFSTTKRKSSKWPKTMRHRRSVRR